MSRKPGALHASGSIGGLPQLAPLDVRDVATAQVQVAVACPVDEVDPVGGEQRPHLGGHVRSEEDRGVVGARRRARDEVADEGWLR